MVRIQLGHYWDEIWEYINQPHKKKKLRLLAWKHLSELGILDTEFTEKVLLKSKLFERAKPGKRIRIIGDFSTEGSLLGGFLLDYMKKSIPIVDKEKLYFEFVSSAEPSKLDKVSIRLLEDSRDQVYVFSDDMLLKIGGVILEADISGCDAGNRKGAFKILSEFAGDDDQFSEVMNKTIIQCSLPLKLQDPESKFGFRIRPVEPVQSSGTVITTLINTIQAAAIGFRCHIDGSNSDDRVRASALRVGHEVTASVCQNIAKAVLLKHAWDPDHGGSVTCLMTSLKPLGVCTGELPGRGDITSRAVAWNSAVASCAVHSGHYERFFKQFVVGKPDTSLLPYDLVKHLRKEKCRAASDNFYSARYTHVTPLVDAFFNKKYNVGCVYRSTLVSLAAQIDYGQAERII